MQSPKHPTPRVSAPSNAFDSAFLEDLHARDGEPLTAAEAELSGPWKQEPVPGHPGAVAVLRFWESQAAGDLPQAVFRHEESAALCSAVLPLVEREPLFHLSEVPDTSPDCPLPGGHPLTAFFGEQGPVVIGWLRHYHQGVVEALHLVEALVRLPMSLARVNAAAGAGALAQVGRFLVTRPEA
jgi:hypothetical protein